MLGKEVILWNSVVVFYYYVIKIDKYNNININIWELIWKISI